MRRGHQRKSLWLYLRKVIITSWQSLSPLLEPFIADGARREMGNGTASSSTLASSASRALSQKRSMRPMRQETADCGAKPNASTGKSSSSSAGPIRKGCGLIRVVCCSATIPMMASSFTPAVWAPGCPDPRRRLDPLARKTSSLNALPPRKTAPDRHSSFLACIGSSRNSLSRSPI